MTQQEDGDDCKQEIQQDNQSVFVEGEEEELKEAVMNSEISGDQNTRSSGSDIETQDINQIGQQLAEENDCGFISTSARTGFNTQEAFEELCRMILVAQGHIKPDPTKNRVHARM